MNRMTHQWRNDDTIGLADAVATGRPNEISGTSGNDTLSGKHGPDRFFMQDGGTDSVRAGASNDDFYFGGALTAADQVNGGEGRDRLRLEGDYSADLELDPHQLKGLESIQLEGERTYDLTLDDGFGDLRFLADTNATLHIDASALTTGSVAIDGGRGTDVLIGGAGGDRFDGKSGADVFTGGAGDDRFLDTFDSDSQDIFRQSPDTITDFSEGDRICLPTRYRIDFISANRKTGSAMSPRSSTPRQIGRFFGYSSMATIRRT